MHATESRSPTLPAVAADRRGELRVDCYVRPRMPGPTGDRIAAVVERLQRLDEADAIAAYRIAQWPAEHHVAAETDDTQRPTRQELVTEFECWAEQRGYSLEPTFRRRTLPSWPLGSDDAERRERVRVPVVALALYDVTRLDGETQQVGRNADAPVPPETDALCGVVPYTDSSGADEQRRNCAVTEWLSAAETRWCDSATAPFERDQRSVLEGQ